CLARRGGSLITSFELFPSSFLLESAIACDRFVPGAPELRPSQAPTDFAVGHANSKNAVNFSSKRTAQRVLSRYASTYGTRKNFPVYGSFTTDPDAKSVTSIYLSSSGR